MNRKKITSRRVNKRNDSKRFRAAVREAMFTGRSRVPHSSRWSHRTPPIPSELDRDQ